MTIQKKLAGYEATKPYYEIGSPAGLQALEARLTQINSLPTLNDLFIETYLDETIRIAERIDRQAIADGLARLEQLRRNGGRLFILGNGGSAANASHAVNDFRKIAGIEAYAPTDNVAELTARTNDDGWEHTFDDWLRISNLTSSDAVLVLSVGGGDADQNISPNIVLALKRAGRVGACVLGVVAGAGGYTSTVANVCVRVPIVNNARITPHAENWQMIIVHLWVNALAERLYAP